MDARTVDDAARELRELRRDEKVAMVLGPLVLVLAVLATQIGRTLAIPLLAGGIYVMAWAIRVEFRRYCLLDDLSGERDAYGIPEVAGRARQAASMPNRRSMAASIHLIVQLRGRPSCSAELEELAVELEREDLDLDPAFAVACRQLVSDATSPLLDPSADPGEVSWRVRHIRSGFTEPDVT